MQEELESRAIAENEEEVEGEGERRRDSRGVELQAART